MTIAEKAAYLKGLTDGLEFEPDSRHAKLWAALNELLLDVAHKLEELDKRTDAHEEALDDVYEQLIELQEIAEPEEDWSGWEDEDEDEDIYTPSLRLYEDEDEENGGEEGAALEPGDEELDYDGVLYDVVCPSCGETITFDEETLEKGGIRCPSCGETLEFDLGENE